MSPTLSAISLIPRRDLFGDPARIQANISPDGRWLSWLAPDDGILNVWIASVTAVTVARCVTRDRRRGIQFYAWSCDSQHLLYLQDRNGDENWHIHAVEITNGDAHDLTPIGGIHAQIVGISPDRPNTLVIGLNDRDARWHDLYQADIATGNRRLVLRNDSELFGFVLDRQLTIRLAMRSLPGGGRQLLRSDGNVFSEIIRIPREDNLTTSPIGMNAAGDAFFILSSIGRDKAALLKVDWETGRQQILAEHPKADIDRVLINQMSEEIEAASANHLRREWLPITGAESAWQDLSFLSRQLEGEISIVSQTANNERWVVRQSNAENPETYYLFDRERKDLVELFSARPNLSEVRLQPMHSKIIRSRDDLELVSYLTLPKSVGQAMRPPAPLPMVLLVHGGPWSRNFWGFDAFHQWLANRGYAVLNVNFRGSTGFGKAFLNAGDGEWGRKMQDDLLDGVAWAVEEGIADRCKIAIMGGSYGGYAALAALAFTPDIFCCGVDRVGPSNLETMIASTPAYWAESFEIDAYRVGDPRTEEGRALLRERSPLHQAHAIRKPLLIGHGANDVRVTQSESDQIVAAMKKNRLPVTYVVYSDEGHAFVRPQSRLSWYAIVETFLATHLDGRAESIGNDLRDANFDVREGISEIVGLVEALQSKRSSATPRQNVLS